MATKKKLSPKKAAKKQTHFDRMAKQEKQAKQIKELRQEVKTLTANLNGKTIECDTLNESVAAINQLQLDKVNLENQRQSLQDTVTHLDERIVSLSAQVHELENKNKELFTKNQELEESAKNHLTTIDNQAARIQEMSEFMDMIKKDDEAPATANAGSQS